MARSALLNVMVQAVLKAGRTLSRDFGEVENLQVSIKGPNDFVTAADKRAEKTLMQELEKARPNYGFLAEESGTTAGSDKTHRWIIDPLDGTTNFLHGIPIFAISLALERDGEIVAGVIHNPIMNELFVAEKGGGAFFNDRRMRVAGRSDLMSAVVACGIPHFGRDGRAEFLRDLPRVMDGVSGVRRCGSAAIDLAWVVTGRFDGFWERGLLPWDMAAGMILIREAGGTVTDMDGGAHIFETGGIVAGNATIHSKLIGLLGRARSGA